MDEFKEWLDEALKEAVGFSEYEVIDILEATIEKYRSMTCTITWEGMGSDCFICSACGDRTWERSPKNYCSNCGRKVLASDEGSS